MSVRAKDFEQAELRKVLVLVNPKSGLPRSFSSLRREFDKYWDVPGIDLSYQFTTSAEDGVDKVKRAVDNCVDTVLVIGGDGTISSVGRALVGTDVALGVIPSGSGNGFARHCGIPLVLNDAIRSLATADVRPIDVGIVNGNYFFVTCSMAWDAAFVKSFDKSPMRGVLPYIFAGFQEFLQYKVQDVTVEIDSGKEETFVDPMVFTIANMTQFGGGAKIAPHAEADDGLLELVVVGQQDVARVLTQINKLFDGSLHRLSSVQTRQLKSMKVYRELATPIQIDGELVDAPAEIDVAIMPKALKVLFPK
ncbi:MAG: diacylglycerol kinase family lipid kinase [Kiritimatiellae bacterium]|nr:diacylglycerol kinase family lipid kinase [Kiritimatiellia bacterium]